MKLRPRLIPGIALAVFLATGCSRPDESAATATRAAPPPDPAASTATPSAPAPTEVQVQPSYEVAIASAVGDHERGLDDCKARPKGEIEACTEAVDATYTQAKEAAEKGRAESP